MLAARQIQTRGRRIQNKNHLYATFWKRRIGVYKKASELCTLCTLDIGIIIFSPTNTPYSFFSPNMESVVNRFLNLNHQTSDFAKIIEMHARAKIDDFNGSLDKAINELEQVKERENRFKAMERYEEEEWWEDLNIRCLNLGAKNEQRQWLQDLHIQLIKKEVKLENRRPGSSETQLVNNPTNDARDGLSFFSQNYFPTNPFFGQSLYYDWYFPPQEAQCPPPQVDEIGDAGPSHHGGMDF